MIRKPIFTPMVLAAIIFISGTYVSATEITRNLKQTIDSVLLIVNDDDLKNKATIRREKLKNVIDQRFNYRQMAMRSLAKAWAVRTPQERNEFIKQFKSLLEHSYASKIESFGQGEVEYQDEIVKGNYAMVKTRVARKNDRMKVDYKLIKENGQWQVYDIVVEGVSMIRNYRSQFTKILQEESFAGLMKRITVTPM